MDAEVLVIVIVELNVVDSFSSTEIKVPKAGLNLENASEFVQSVGAFGRIVGAGLQDWV